MCIQRCSSVYLGYNEWLLELLFVFLPAFAAGRDVSVHGPNKKVHV